MQFEYLEGGLFLRGEQARTLHALLPDVSRLVVYEGQEVCVIKHTPEVDTILHNVGAVVESAILRDKTWVWPGQFQPWEHQRATASFMTVHRRGFILNDPGTGKTGAAIWACEYLSRTDPGATLIIGPLSTLRSVWHKELFCIAPGRRVELIVGSADQKRKALGREAEYYVINHDGIKNLLPELIAKKNIRRIIVDEATAFKSQSSDRWKALHKLMGDKSVWLMTGTPMSQSPEDAYALIKLVSPQRVPPTFGSWQGMVMLKIKRFVFVPRKEATRVVYDAMQPAIRFNKADCIDLPEVTFVDYEVGMTAEQRSVMSSLKDTYIAQTKDGGLIVADNAAVRIGKMLQVMQGAVKMGEGELSHVDVSPRLEAIGDLCAQSEGKTITFVSYTACLQLVANYLRKRFGKDAVAIIDGSVTGQVRAKIVADFQQPGHPIRHLVCHPQTAAHGLTLTEANTTIWNGPVMSNEQYTQGNARTDRAGQKRKSTVYNIIGSNLEREMFKALRTMSMSQQGLLALYEGEMKGVYDVTTGRTSPAAGATVATANAARTPRYGARPDAAPFFIGRRSRPGVGA